MQIKTKMFFLTLAFLSSSLSSAGDPYVEEMAQDVEEIVEKTALDLHGQDSLADVAERITDLKLHYFVGSKFLTQALVSTNDSKDLDMAFHELVSALDGDLAFKLIALSALQDFHLSNNPEVRERLLWSIPRVAATLLKKGKGIQIRDAIMVIKALEGTYYDPETPFALKIRIAQTIAELCAFADGTDRDADRILLHYAVTAIKSNTNIIVQRDRRAGIQKTGLLTTWVTYAEIYADPRDPAQVLMDSKVPPFKSFDPLKLNKEYHNLEVAGAVLVALMRDAGLEAQHLRARAIVSHEALFPLFRQLAQPSGRPQDQKIHQLAPIIQTVETGDLTTPSYQAKLDMPDLNAISGQRLRGFSIPWGVEILDVAKGTHVFRGFSKP